MCIYIKLYARFADCGGVSRIVTINLICSSMLWLPILHGVLYLSTVSCFCRCLLLTLQLLPRWSLFVLLLQLLFLIGFDLVEYGRNELENDIARNAQTSVLNVADA